MPHHRFFRVCLFAVSVLALACTEHLPSMYSYSGADDEISGPETDLGDLPDLDGESSGEEGEASTDGDLPETPDGDGEAEPEAEEEDVGIRCARRVAEGGFGDSTNRIAYAMADFNGSLYVGAYTGEGGGLLDPTPDQTTGARIYRYDGENWTEIVRDGFGDANNFAVRLLIVHEERLFAFTENRATGAEVYVTDNGEEWDRFADEGMGNPQNTAVVSAVHYGKQLFVGTENSEGGGELWELSGRHFEQRFSGGFDNPANSAISSLGTFKGNIFAGTTNISGAELFRTSGESYFKMFGLNAPKTFPSGHITLSAMRTYDYALIFSTGNLLSGFSIFRTDNGLNFDQVAERGLTNSNLAYVMAMEEFDGVLLLGTMNSGSIFDPLNEGGSLFRSNGIDYSELVGGEERWAPPGFDNSHNYALMSMAVSMNKLYIGTAQCLFCSSREGLEIWEVESLKCP